MTPRLLIPKKILRISHTYTASPLLRQMLHRDLDRHTMSLVLLSGFCLDNETSARLRARAKAALGHPVLPEAAVWWAMTYLPAWILDHIACSSCPLEMPLKWAAPVRVQGKQALESGLLGNAIQWLAHEQSL